jgi:Uma2 family endonuclease
MSTFTSPPRRAIIYPDCDGQPMSDNTLQFKWIVTIEGGIDALFVDDPNVFVAGDLLWYPVEGEPNIRSAPDVMVVFGRRKGYRGSYRQWEEGGIPPQAVFEILSPGNRAGAMERKFQFYERHGVEEYYIYDPDHGDLVGWRRAGANLEEIPKMAGFVSPLLKIRFEPGEGPDNLKIIGPDGEPFQTYTKLVKQRNADRERANEKARLAEENARLAEENARLAEEKARLAEEKARLAEENARLADEQTQRADRLAARLRELGVEPE